MIINTVFSQAIFEEFLSVYINNAEPENCRRSSRT